MSSSKKRNTATPNPPKENKRAKNNPQDTGSSSESPPVRESIQLPAQMVVSNDIQVIMNALKQLSGNGEDPASFKYPIIIGSRAAAHWIPYFRPYADWDLIATPQQAFNMVNDLSAESSLTISLIWQPLNKSIVRRKPMTAEIHEILNGLPVELYKISGELKGALKFEIEIAGKYINGNLIPSSIEQLFKVCCAENNDSTAYLNFPIGFESGHQCIVAPLEVLETIKCSHIHWPAYFSKHISDIHLFRTVMTPSASSQVNIGHGADKGKPLTAPERTSELKHLLLVRALETEAFRGTPGSHINLNVSNEDFLGRDDDLFVDRHIPHDDVHNLVKYGDSPIYDQLKTDSSKAMISRILFEKAPYDMQIKCVKEEAMVIALERFLLPKLSSDPSAAFMSALTRICTTLTKGWFRDFSIDNFTRLTTCDKNLLAIRDEILKKHPLPPKFWDDPLEILKKSISNLDDLAIAQKLIPMTKSINKSEVQRYVANIKAKEPQSGIRGMMYNSNRHDENEFSDEHSSEFKLEENFWAIRSSTQGHPPLLVSFVNQSDFDFESCKPSSSFCATLSVQPLNGNTNLADSHNRNSRNFRKLAIDVDAQTSGGSWGGGDIWSRRSVTSKSLVDEIKMLDVEGLTEDLLMKFIISIVQPQLHSNGETPLVNKINALKSDGSIPYAPKNHLWFDLWKYNCN